MHGPGYAILPPAGHAGIRVNDIPAVVASVAHHGTRVDLKQGASMAFIVEHPLAMLGILGISSADITGTRTTWDFFRPADREALARGLDPRAVLGPADGSIGKGMFDEMVSAGTIETPVAPPGCTTTGPVAIDVPGGNRISFTPPGEGMQGLDVTIALGPVGPARFHHGPHGILVDERGIDIRRAVVEARSAAVVGPCDEALLHALGDVIADVVVLGGITDGTLDARLGLAYHRATIGLVKEAAGRCLLSRRDQ